MRDITSKDLAINSWKLPTCAMGIFTVDTLVIKITTTFLSEKFCISWTFSWKFSECYVKYKEIRKLPIFFEHLPI